MTSVFSRPSFSSQKLQHKISWTFLLLVTSRLCSLSAACQQITEEGHGDADVATAPQKLVMPWHYMGHSFSGWGTGDIWVFIVVFKAHEVRLAYSWLFNRDSWGVGGGEVGIKDRGIISDCELTMGAGALVQPLAEDANNRERDCSLEILVPKFTRS